MYASLGKPCGSNVSLSKLLPISSKSINSTSLAYILGLRNALLLCKCSFSRCPDLCNVWKWVIVSYNNVRAFVSIYTIHLISLFSIPLHPLDTYQEIRVTFSSRLGRDTPIVHSVNSFSHQYKSSLSRLIS